MLLDSLYFLPLAGLFTLSINTMFKLFLLTLALVLALAGRVHAQTQSAFNVTLGSSVLSSTQILSGLPSSNAAVAACSTQCNQAQTDITACNNDPSCLCTNATAGALLTCQQCMFTNLINMNKPAPEARVGSNPLVQAYATSCTAFSQPIPSPLGASFALTLPSSWDGPFDSILPFGGMILTVFVGGTLGVGAILILCNM